jgi:hypothetical protein
VNETRLGLRGKRAEIPRCPRNCDRGVLLPHATGFWAGKAGQHDDPGARRPANDGRSATGRVVRVQRGLCTSAQAARHERRHVHVCEVF